MAVLRAREAISSLPLFRDISASVVNELAAKSRVLTVGQGTVVVHQGAPADSLFGVVAGRVKISIEKADGTATTLSILGPGEILGELGVLGASERSAQITALEPLTLVSVPGVAFLRALRADPMLGAALSIFLAGRLRALALHFQHVTALPAPARVAQKLLFLVERFGQPVARGVGVSLRLTQTDLAELCDLSRQRTNAVLRDLVRRKIIERSGRSWTIIDMDALRALV